MRNLKFSLFAATITLLSCLSSCSQDDVYPESAPASLANVDSSTVTVGNQQTMTVSELINIVQSDCEEYELNFLKSLPQKMEVYVYTANTRSNRFPALTKANADKNSLLLNDSHNIKVTSLPIAELDNSKISLFATTRGYTEPRSIKEIPVTGIQHEIFGYMEIDATVNYIYDVEEHIITEAGSIVCDVNDEQQIGEFLFDWADKGSTMSISYDKIGLLCNVNGDVILGLELGKFPVGFKCTEIRGNNFEITVPYN